MDRIRCGVVICPIWKDLRQIVPGNHSILVHYIRVLDNIECTAAFTRYNGVITDITEKFKTITLKPDWREKLERRIG